MFTLKMKYVYSVTIIFVIKHTLQDSFHFQVIPKMIDCNQLLSLMLMQTLFAKNLHLRYTVFLIFSSFLSIEKSTQPMLQASKSL